MTPKGIAGVEGEALCFPSVIHEIEGRLASITMYSDELIRQVESLDSTTLRRRLTRIHCLATETQRVIDAVRRLDDETPLERVDIDLSELCSRILDRHSVRTPQFEHLLVRIQSNIHIHGDRDLVDVLLDNLIGNALKFTSRRESPQLRITASNESNRSVVHVSDNGVGIAPEDTDRIFQPFTRCHPGFPGTGVGLATTRRIVERHGGRIWATGETGLGTTISFFL